MLSVKFINMPQRMFAVLELITILQKSHNLSF